MDIITNNIYNDIVELSELNLQRKLWLNENNDTGKISSYVEVMCRLFDDNRFEDFIENTASKINLSNSAIYELSRLEELLNNYNEKDSDEEIIGDPKWGEIVAQAKRTLREWNKSSLPPSAIPRND